MMKPETHLRQLHSQFLAGRFPFQLELACSRTTAIVSESEEVKSRRGVSNLPLAISTGEASETYQLGFPLGD